jgi:hypothetical protein
MPLSRTFISYPLLICANLPPEAKDVIPEAILIGNPGSE